MVPPRTPCHPPQCKQRFMAFRIWLCWKEMKLKRGGDKENPPIQGSLRVRRLLG